MSGLLLTDDGSTKIVVWRDLSHTSYVEDQDLNCHSHQYPGMTHGCQYDGTSESVQNHVALEMAIN